jgi:hypothetical protein
MLRALFIASVARFPVRSHDTFSYRQIVLVLCEVVGRKVNGANHAPDYFAIDDVGVDDVDATGILLESRQTGKPATGDPGEYHRVGSSVPDQ